MSTLPNLRYYRGQFDPSQGYQQAGGSYQGASGGDSGIISMYNPQIENQFLAAAEKAQSRYDASNLAFQQEKSRIGELDTYDLKDLETRLNSFESGVKTLVNDKYNGDYGAAANEIAKMIGTERTNPFYHFNKEKVEMGKSYLDAKSKLGVNFIETSSPFDVSFEDWQQGKKFDFTPINRNDIVQNSAATFSTLAKTLVATPDVELAAGNRLLKIAIQHGLKDPEAVRAFLETPAGLTMYNQVLDTMPELTNVKDPAKVHDAIVQGAYAAIGGTDVNFATNPGYKAELAAGTGEGGRRVALAGMEKGAVSIKDLYAGEAWKTTRDRITKEEASKAGLGTITDFASAPKHIQNLVKDRMFNEIPNNKNLSTPFFDINVLNGTEPKDLAASKANMEQMSLLINELPEGTFMGADDKSTRQLKNLTDFVPERFAFVITENPLAPIASYVNASGTATNYKGTGKAPSEKVKTMINPFDINSNKRLLDFIGSLPGGTGLYTSTVNKLLLNNPEGARLILEIPHTPEGDEALAILQEQVKALYKKK